MDLVVKATAMIIKSRRDRIIKPQRVRCTAVSRTVLPTDIRTRTLVLISVVLPSRQINDRC